MSESIGKMLDELRIKAGFETLGQLHKASGVTTATLSRIINNIQKPSTETLKKLAPCLRVKHEFLLEKAGYLEPATTEKSLSPKKPKDLLKILEQEDYTLNGRLATPEDKERLATIVEAMFWDAKEKNKRKR